MAASGQDAALRKRQQIDSSNKTMFIFVAISAFVVGIALVVAFFLVQQIIFHSKIMLEKQNTITTLDKNITAAKELKDNLRVLDTNEALSSVKLKPESSTLQSVLDALPSEPNADALGASLQRVFVGGVDGLTLESLTVGSHDIVDAGTENSIPFTLSVSGSAVQLKNLLTRFEKSIRVIHIQSIDMQASESKLTMNIRGSAQYEPAQHIQLENKVVKP